MEDDQLLHQIQILFKAVIGVCCNIAGMPAEGFAGGMGELIPDGETFPVFESTAFNLI